MTRRSAFTLIELLAASALAAVLMLVMFQVIGSLGRTRAALMREEGREDSTAQSPWKSDLLDGLRWDLANATGMKLEPNRITLTGHGSLDRRTLAPGDAPVTVVYAVERRGDRSCLIRREAARGSLTNQPGSSELVCADVSRFVIEPVPTRRRVGVPAKAAPLRVRIALAAGTLIDEVLVLK